MAVEGEVLYSYGRIFKLVIHVFGLKATELQLFSPPIESSLKRLPGFSVLHEVMANKKGKTPLTRIQRIKDTTYSST